LNFSIQLFEKDILLYGILSSCTKKKAFSLNNISETARLLAFAFLTYKPNAISI